MRRESPLLEEGVSGFDGAEDVPEYDLTRLLAEEEVFAGER